MGPSSRASSTPVTITVWGTLQLAAVKVRLAGATVPSVVSELARPIVTGADGWLVSARVNVALPPASVVTSPATGVTVIPTASLSSFATETLAAFTPLYTGSALTAGAVTIV